MKAHKGQFPEGWEYSKFLDLYYYRGIMVKRKDRGRGMIELVARDKNDNYYSVLAKGLREAMKEMEGKLNTGLKRNN